MPGLLPGQERLELLPTDCGPPTGWPDPIGGNCTRVRRPWLSLALPPGTVRRVPAPGPLREKPTEQSDPNGDPLLGRRVGDYIDVGRADLAEHELRGIELLGRYVLLSRHAGVVCAIDDQCNHAGCMLSSGWVEKQTAAVVCPCHEYEFELASGRNVTVPRLCEDQEKFAVRVDEGRILVLLGERR